MADRHRNERRRWDIVIGGYNVGMVCYSLTNPISIEGMLMVGCKYGVDVENLIRTTALSRRVDGMEGVSWCGAGSVIIAEQHRDINTFQ